MIYLFLQFASSDSPPPQRTGNVIVNAHVEDHRLLQDKRHAAAHPESYRGRGGGIHTIEENLP
jgi:hypothetical protein